MLYGHFKGVYMAFDFPSETVDLPSRGWYYPADNPLSTGKVELKYMTAAEENILSSKNLIMKGTAINKLMEALIVSPGVKYKDLLIGDKNALMVAARVFGYGKDYDTSCECPNCQYKNQVTIDLVSLKDKEIDFEDKQKGKNEFLFLLPFSNIEITFKLLTQGDDDTINKELEALKKGVKSEVSPEVTTRMRYMILSVNGDRSREKVREFVETALLSRDVEAFRQHTRKINPDIDLTFDFECTKCGYDGRLEVPIDVTFFWPYARV